MNHYEIAEEGCGENLKSIIRYCIDADGIVYGDKDVFFCAYPTNFFIDKGTLWHISMIAGDVHKADALIPESEYISFFRNDERVRVVDRKKFLRRMKWTQ